MKDPTKYEVDRPLTDAERKNHLPQKVATPSSPWPQLSVIRMNSTFLECVDGHFGYTRGWAVTTMLPCLCVAGFIIIFAISHIIEKWSVLTGGKFFAMLSSMTFGIVLFIPIFLFLLYLMKFDVFHYTHYPQRFNRKTRMVHVFLDREKGKILSVPWDELYFTCSPVAQGDCEIRAHQLAEDGITVLNSFALSQRSLPDSEYRFMQWEFVRRYMEEGPEQLADMVTEVMDVAERREGYWHGFRRLWANFSGRNPLLALITLPLAIIFGIGRYIAMLTCKVPHWPEEIERECRFEPDDPYLRDRNHLAPPGAVPEPRV